MEQEMSAADRAVREFFLGLFKDQHPDSPMIEYWDSYACGGCFFFGLSGGMPICRYGGRHEVPTETLRGAACGFYESFDQDKQAQVWKTLVQLISEADPESVFPGHVKLPPRLKGGALLCFLMYKFTPMRLREIEKKLHATFPAFPNRTPLTLIAEMERNAETDPAFWAGAERMYEKAMSLTWKARGIDDHALPSAST